MPTSGSRFSRRSRGNRVRTAVPGSPAAAAQQAFQYLGSIDQPRQIGVVTAGGRTLYDFRTGRVMMAGGSWERTSGLAAGEAAQFFTVVYGWESLLLPSTWSRQADGEAPVKVR